ncbi:replicative helicase loader/inhibitor [Rossellomorea marisflavi]|uniref:replicative helicase loader/inhibitor n=1 Tax=Rossellomorea marisflavi TaxID=189381 RepID=UPI0025B24600|nr:replicative helicase loader/inhibitor [Rossellomorea marisflavi]WJV19638.1 replicative helicase loader/inhibitor [Rossellomorea marisflavi]
MTKEQVFEVMSLFKEVYNNFHFDQTKLNTWHRLLKDKDSAVILQNAEKLSLCSKFVPSLSELVNYSEEEPPFGPAVPTAEETQQMLQERARSRRNAASPEVREKALAEIRRILNIPDEVNENESVG